jgi:hypothetical protein
VNRHHFGAMSARTAQDVTVAADDKTREIIKAFHEVVQLSHVDDSAPEPDALQIRQLTDGMAQSSGELEAVVSQLKYAAIIRDGRECEELVVKTADGFDALAHAQGLAIEQILSEVDQSLRELDAELHRAARRRE